MSNNKGNKRIKDFSKKWWNVNTIWADSFYLFSSLFIKSNIIGISGFSLKNIIIKVEVIVNVIASINKMFDHSKWHGIKIPKIFDIIIFNKIILLML